MVINMDVDRPNDPLHGVTLKVILEELVGRRGWRDLSAHVSIRCFESDPSIPSSLKFLRRTPWARQKVEALYIADMRERQERRERRRRGGRPASDGES
jgi:uncharacterized protein (DUF2132 family)